MAGNADEIVADLSPLLKAYKSGRIERLSGEDFVPPALDPTTGVQSKDVVISPEINLSARIYRPENADRSKKLPLLVFFHGGAFISQSAFCHLYHKHLNHLVARTKVVAVSVNYRLAPEFPLPIAFEDSWQALKWSAEGKDEWINEFADLNSVYLGGDSAGANIAHNVAMRAGSEGLNLRGIFLNCPFFGGEDPIGNESAEHLKFAREFTDKLWRFACSSAKVSDLDEAWINPSKDGDIGKLGCRRVVIHVGGKDFLRERGLYYAEVLRKSEWDGEVECVEIEGEEHVFSVFNPESRHARQAFFLHQSHSVVAESHYYINKKMS